MRVLGNESAPETLQAGRGGAGRDRRGPQRSALALVAVLGLLFTSCTGPASAPLDIVVPLEPLRINLPAVEVDLGLCTGSIALPEIEIAGMTLSIPEVTADPDSGVLAIPSVLLSSPASVLSFPAVEATCSGFPPVSLNVEITVPAVSAGGAITMDFAQRLVVIDSLLFEVTGAEVTLPDLGNVSIPLPDISIPLDGVSIPF